MNLLVLRTWLRARFTATERGASMVEYILLVALIALAVFAAVTALACSAGHTRTWRIQPDGLGNAPTIQAGIDSAATGDTVLVGRKPTGTLILGNLKPGKRLYMLSTGTGIAPFSALINTLAQTAPHRLYVFESTARGYNMFYETWEVAKKSPIFSCLPLDVYMDWLASNLTGLASVDPELETPALRMPKQLPEAWLRYGLNAANWKEAVRTISRRFRWLESTASAMRRDCRRFVADSSPPPG